MFHDTDVAITGMALRVPGADTLEAFWSRLRDGVESITRFTDEELAAAGVDAATLASPNYVKAKAVLTDVAGFDPGFFGLSAREAAFTDPQHRLFLECAWHALEHAGCAAEPADGPVGVYAGAGTSLYLLHHLIGNPAVTDMASWFEVMLANTGDALATRASYALDLRGPSVNVQSACSTSLVAVHMAVQALLNGECRVALAGGVSLDLPLTRGYWWQDGMILSPDGHCRPFDAQARGTVAGSGVGVVVVKRLADALADGDTVHAVIKGTAINNDGHHKIGFTAPSTEGQASVIADALQVAGVEASTIGYVEAHGTGTPLGDPIEVAALAQVFGHNPGQRCAIGSLKSNLGHLNTAAGVVGLIKAALSVRDGVIAPTLHFAQANPQLNLDTTPFYVPTQQQRWDAPLRRAGVSSFGMGGTNAHVVIEQAPATAPRPQAGGWQVLPLSARSAAALQAQATQLADHLARHPALALADVAFTLQQGRRAFAQRRALVCRDLADAVAQLRGESSAAGDEALHALAQRWCTGESVRWPGTSGQRIPLPGYPFEHQRCWIEPPATASTTTSSTSPDADPLAMPARTPDLADWFYQPVWRELPSTATQAPSGPVLLLADAHGLAESVAQRFDPATTIITALPGDSFTRTGTHRYTVRPSASGDYQALLTELDTLGLRPALIVHGFALHAGGRPVPAAAELLATLPKQLDLGLHALLALVQALGQRPTSERYRLLVALSHAFEILDDRPLRPEQATLLGAAKIVSQEHDNIACRCVDIGATDDPLAAAMLWQALQDSGPDVVVHRAGRRWVQAYEPARVPAQLAPARLRPQGHYLITGGLGGMGLAFAEELSAQCQARLVLVGRSVFPDRADWDDWLREHGSASGEARRVCDTIQRLRAIEATGAQVVFHAADVSDLARMREIVDDARQRFGPLHGVLHAAGVADYEGVIRGRTQAQTDRTIAAKVQGTLVLDTLTQADPLDFFLMCSSLGTVLYHIKFGQVGYAAANEFIDQYARARRARGAPGFTVAINWSDWRESGMSVAALARWAQRHQISDMAPDEEGLSDLEGRAVMLRALMQDAPRVAVAQHDLAVLIRQDPLRAKSYLSDAAATQARPDTGTAYAAPRDEIERRIAAIWQKLLGLERVGVDDDFYDLGGHSLLATQAVARVNDALAVDVPVDDFLDTPTVAALAALVRSARAARAPGAAPTAQGITPRGHDAPVPLSFAQQRLWLLHQIEPDPASYNMPMALVLEGELDRAALQATLDRILARHESLRTTFREAGGNPVQVVQPPQPCALAQLDLRVLPAHERDAAARAAAEQEARTAFDLTSELPLRGSLLQLDDQRHLLLLTKHHIASDGWSMGVLMREISALYAAFRQGLPDPLPPLPVQYADFAQWQQAQLAGERLEAGLDWWRERLDGVPDLDLPTDLPRPAERSGRGGLLGVPLPAPLCEQLDAFGRSENATRFMTLLAAFFVLLQRYSGQDDFAVGTPIANRTRPEIEPLIGFFANTLVLRAQLQGDPSFRELVDRVRQNAQGAFAHQEIPFEKLVDALDAAGGLDRTPLFQVLFVLQNSPGEPLQLPGLRYAPLVADTATAKFDLTLSVIPDGAGLHALFEYSTDLFLADTIETLAQQYAVLLANLLSQPDAPVSAAALQADDPSLTDSPTS